MTPLREHQHEFVFHLALVDRWACVCGMSTDHLRGLWNADGTRAQLTVTCTAEASAPEADRVDFYTWEYLRYRREQKQKRERGVCSGRERLTC